MGAGKIKNTVCLGKAFTRADSLALCRSVCKLQDSPSQRVLTLIYLEIPSMAFDEKLLDRGNFGVLFCAIDSSATRFPEDPLRLVLRQAGRQLSHHTNRLSIARGFFFGAVSESKKGKVTLQYNEYLPKEFLSAQHKPDWLLELTSL